MYGTIVVGTDGSQSSFLAVRRAAAIAAAFDAKLVLASAYFADSAEAVASREDSVTLVGEPDAEQVLAAAMAEAKDEGATDIHPVMQAGPPVVALMAVVADVEADLLVVGNRGINSLTGRLLGSVPADVARQSECDVMIVNTAQ